MTRHLAVLAFSAALAATPLSAAPAHCEDLVKLALPATTIKGAGVVDTVSFTPPGGQPIGKLPPFCRAMGSLHPSADSDIEFEVWMPASNWNGKFQGIGNGGFAGSINYPALAAALSHGYATASTDTGHAASSTEGAWALGHPEKVADFGYRAIHETTGAAKSILRAFYGQAPRRSYFSSCSNGGRQGLMEAQRYPEDYDGIVAGAPANNWTRLFSGGIGSVIAALAASASYIPPSKLPAIEAAALAACDATDGLKDGLIGDPVHCNFQPKTMLCKSADSDTCLTAPQAAALEKIYAGSRDAQGRRFFPGYLPGGETGSGGWIAWITGSAPEKSTGYAFVTTYFRNMVFASPSWTYRSFNAERDAKVADDSLSRVLNATDPNLKKFKDRGGRLILYHGWSDPAIPALSTVSYYDSVVSKMGEKDTAEFVRLFMVPGMQHCFGGPGPNNFGQNVLTGGDPEHDIDAAVERWVEQGVAPERIVAAKFKDAASPARVTQRTRPLCKYPELARWTGKGSTDDAANFVCAQPGPERGALLLPVR